MHHLLSRASWAAFAAVLGCSAISDVDYAQCTESAACRDAFGLGSVCGSAGLCEQAEAFERCAKVYPLDLFKDPEKYRDAIVIGSMLDHTKATGDTIMVNAATLAVKEANGTGLGDRSFAIVHCDYQENQMIDSMTSEEAAVASAQYLVDQLGVPVIVGPGTSGLAQAVYTELAKPVHGDGTLIVSPSATSPSLTDIDPSKPGLFWRTAPPDSVVGAKLAQYMVDEGVGKAVVLYEDNTYGKGLATELAKNFTAPLTLIAYQDPMNINDHVLAIRDGNQNPQAFGVVFIASDVDQVNSFLGSAGVDAYYAGPEIKIFLGDTAFNVDVISKTAATAKDIYPNIRGVFPGAPSGPVYDLFRSSYNADPDFDEDAMDASYSSHSYDATWLAIYGAAWSYFQHDQQITGRFMAEGLQNISSGAAFRVGDGDWSSIKTAFSTKKSVNIVGASGELDYDPETEETTAPVIRWTIVSDGGGGYEFQTIMEGA